MSCVIRVLLRLKLSKGGIFINTAFFLKEGITFINTILGVFIGFLLSSYWYKRNKRKEKLNLDLKYIILANKEVTANKKLFIDCLNILNENLEEINLNEKKYEDMNFNQDFSKETIDKCQNLIRILNKKLNNFENKGVNSAYRAGIYKILKVDSLFNLYNSFEEYKFDLNYKYRILSEPGVEFVKSNFAYVKFIKKSQLIFELLIEHSKLIIEKLDNTKINTEEELRLIRITYKIKIRSKNFKKKISKLIHSNKK